MPVDQSPITIDPYKSQVPLVQIPPQDLQQPPQQSAIYSKAGGIATIADGAMKGLLRGLQLKEEKKYKTAEAVMNAQDAGISAAKKNYDDMLTTQGAFEADGKTPKPETQAAYQAWQTAVNTAAAQRQAFAIPDQKPKGEKGKKKDKNQPDQVPAGGGFAAGLKQFFERNPHIVPELAIIGMKAQVTPYGQKSPEIIKAQQQQVSAQRQDATEQIQLEEAQRKQKAEKVYDQYSGLSAEEVAKLPREAQQAFQAAKAILTPIPRASSTEREYTSPDGKAREWYVPGTEPSGWNATAGSNVGQVGTEKEFTNQALKGYGYTPENAPPNLLKYLHDSWQYRSPQTTSNASEHLETDPNTGRQVAVKTYGSSTRGGNAPQPPSGFAPLGEDGSPQQAHPKTPQVAASKGAGRMTAPPTKTTRGGMTPPPSPNGVRDVGIRSMQGVQNTQRVETEEKGMYANADKAYQAALKTNKAKVPDKASLDAANAQALQAFNASKAQITLWKAAQIKAVGGDPWKQVKDPATGQMRQFAEDDKGNTYGTMDGVNWVNVNTGFPYQEK